MYRFQPISPLIVGFVGITNEVARDFLQNLLKMSHFAQVAMDVMGAGGHYSWNNLQASLESW